MLPQFLSLTNSYKKKQTLLFLGALAVLGTVIIVTGFNGLYGQDAHEYYRYSRVLRDYILGYGPNEEFYWTVLYPLAGTFLGFVLGQGPESLQLLSMLAYAGSVVILFRLLYSKGTNDSILTIYLIIGFILSPNVFKSSMQVMSDPLTAFFVVITLYSFDNFIKSPNNKTLVWLTLAAALAIFTRYPVAIILLPLVLTTLIISLRNKLFLGMALGVIAFALCALPEWWLSVSFENNIQDNYYLGAWSIENIFSSSFDSVDGSLRYGLPNILFYSGIAWHPAYCVLLPITIFWFRRVHFGTIEKVTGIGLLCYIIFLSGMPFQNLRMLLPAYPLILIIFYKPFHRAFTWIWTQSKALSIGGIIGFILLQVTFTVYLSKIFIDRNQLERDVATYLTEKKHARIFGFDLDIGVNHYLKSGRLNVRNLLHQHYEFKENDLLIFNPKVYERQWLNSTINQNINTINHSFDTLKVKTFENNWLVFELVRKE